MSKAAAFVGAAFTAIGLAWLASMSGDEAPPATPPPSPPRPPTTPPKPPIVTPPAGDSITAREARTLDAVRSGRAVFDWVPMLSYKDGQIATFYVFGDALKIDGVRVNAGARLQQQIADLLGARLLTPQLSDLRYASASIQIPPQPMAIAASLAAEREHSERVDRAIAKVAGSSSPVRGRIIAPVGKDWTLGRALATHPGKAQNYGWQFKGKSPGASFEGIKGHAPSVLPDFEDFSVIQPAATAHGLDQDDYSQTVVLVRQAAELNGQPTTIDRILTDPAFAMLASAEGVLPFVRQPGVPELGAIA